MSTDTISLEAIWYLAIDMTHYADGAEWSRVCATRLSEAAEALDRVHALGAESSREQLRWNGALIRVGLFTDGTPEDILDALRAVLADPFWAKALPEGIDVAIDENNECLARLHGDEVVIIDEVTGATIFRG